MSDLDAAKIAKDKADGLFRDRKFTDAVDAYDTAILCDPENKALYSNRAACREKLVAGTYGDGKTALIEAGLTDARRCVALDAAWARGYQRLAAFSAYAVENERGQASKYDDYNVGPREGGGGGALGEHDETSDLRRSPTAAANAAAFRKEGEAACRAGLALDASNEPLRLNLQTLRDAADYMLDPALEPTDAALTDAVAAAAHKKIGSAAFAAKDMKGAEAAFTKAMAFDSTDAVFYSNRSACRAAEDNFRGALADADAAAARKPDWSKAQNRRAVALYALGDYVAAEAACDHGLTLEPGNAALAALKKTCAVETSEPLAVQQQMAKFREEKRSSKKMNDILKGLNFGGQGGGPQVFTPNQFAGLGGMGGGFGGMGGGFGGMGGGGANLNESQMRQMARAMADPNAAANATPIYPTAAASAADMPPSPPGEDPSVKAAQAEAAKWDQASV